MITFSLIPLQLEIIMILVIFGSLFDYRFLILQFVAILVYVMATYFLTEWRAKGFKAQATADHAYNQKATDSLLNFETVKYFNAERHEEKRFEEALMAYKMRTISVAKSLVTLNISQAFVIALGLGSTLALANYFLSIGQLTVGGFVMFNSYNL